MRGATRALTFAAALAVLTGPSHAETVYVIEQLVVAVESAPGGDGERERIGQVKSADKLELIERQGDEAHVRLPNGKDGWIKSSYLTSEEPLQLRVNKLREQVSKLQAAAATAAATATATSVSSPQSPAPEAAASTTPAHAAGPSPSSTSKAAPEEDTSQGRDRAFDHVAVFLGEPGQASHTPWGLLLGTAGVMLLLGFLLGWKTLDRRIRRRYGGLRIY